MIIQSNKPNSSKFQHTFFTNFRDSCDSWIWFQNVGPIGNNCNQFAGAMRLFWQNTDDKFVSRLFKENKTLLSHVQNSASDFILWAGLCCQILPRHTKKRFWRTIAVELRSAMRGLGGTSSQNPAALDNKRNLHDMCTLSRLKLRHGPWRLIILSSTIQQRSTNVRNVLLNLFLPYFSYNMWLHTSWSSIEELHT